MTSTPSPNKLHRIVQKTESLPAFAREQLLTLAFGRLIPYVRTSGVRVESLSAERAVVSIPNAKHVRNHIGGLHAVAMALVAESATGYLVGMNVPDSAVPVIKTMKIDYPKRAKGGLRAVATLTPEQVNQDKEAFAGKLTEEAEHDLNRIGLVLDTLKIQNVSDDVGYLNAIGRMRSAHIRRDAAIAEDLAQEVFIHMFRNLPSIESPAHLKFWLRKVTGHRCIDYSRRQKSNGSKTSLSLDEAPEPVSIFDMPDSMMRTTIRRFVASLPEKPRLVVTLRYQEDLDPTEIAEILEMPLNTVKSHLRRSLAVLKEKVTRCLGEVQA